MNISSYRPGVFSSYTILPSYTGAVEALSVGVVGDFGLEDSLPHTYSRGDFVPLGLLSQTAEVLFAAGLSEFSAVSVGAGSGAQGYTDALAALAAMEAGKRPDLVAVEDCSQEVLAAVKTFVEAQAEEQREMLAFAGCGVLSDAQTTAKAVDSPRVVLSWGSPVPSGEETGVPFLGAAALCAAVAVMEEPVVSLTGHELPGFSTLETEATWAQVDALLEAGVTPLSRSGDGVEAVRVITTSTTLDGSPNRSFSPVNSILIVDYVMKALRQSLTAFIKGARNTPQTLSAVASQVTVLLEELLDRGIITQYGAPSASCPAATPEVCVVRVAFTAAYLINQIQIQAQIQL